MKTLKRIIVGVLGLTGFVLGINERSFEQGTDFWAWLLLAGAVGLFLYWNRWGELE